MMRLFGMQVEWFPVVKLVNKWRKSRKDVILWIPFLKREWKLDTHKVVPFKVSDWRTYKVNKEEGEWESKLLASLVELL